MTTYKIQIDFLTKRECAVLKNNTLSIPFDTGNTDYQAYLKWLEEGNTPEPAENT